jgi:hypothetical protein
MDKSKLINTAIGLTGITIQTCVVLPLHQKNSSGIKDLERKLDQTNQILKEERQEKGKEFKDL